MDRQGHAVARCTVERLMRELSITGAVRGRRVITTLPGGQAGRAPDLADRDFTATEPNTKYVGDITCLPLDGGKFLYLGKVPLSGHRHRSGLTPPGRLGDHGHMRTGLVIDALAAAERTRGSLAGAVPHTDHGAQCTSRAFADACRRAGVRQSMSAIGSSADNALVESFNATSKRETLQGRKHWSSEPEARLEAFHRLHRCNTRRRHSRLGHRSPIAYETASRTTSTTPAPAASLVSRIRSQGPTFNGTIIETGTDSSRLAQSRAKAEQAATT